MATKSHEELTVEGTQMSLHKADKRVRMIESVAMGAMFLFAIMFVVLAFLPVFVLDTDTDTTVIILVVSACTIAVACAWFWVMIAGSMASITSEDAAKHLQSAHEADSTGAILDALMGFRTNAQAATKVMHTMVATFVSLVTVVMLIKLPNGITEDTEAGVVDGIMLTMVRKRLALVVLAFAGLMLLEPPVNRMLAEAVRLAVNRTGGKMKSLSLPSSTATAGPAPALTPAPALAPTPGSIRSWATLSFIMNTLTAWLVVGFAITMACVVGTQATTEISISNSSSWVALLTLLLVMAAVLWFMAMGCHWANRHLASWKEEAKASVGTPGSGSMFAKVWTHLPSLRNPLFGKVYVEWSLNLLMATAIMIIPYLHHGSLDPTIETPRSQELLTSAIIATTPMLLVLLHGVVSLATTVVPSMKTTPTDTRNINWLVMPPGSANTVFIRSAVAAVFLAAITCAIFLFISLLGVKSLAANAPLFAGVTMGITAAATVATWVLLAKISHDPATSNGPAVTTMYTQVGIAKAIITLAIIVPVAAAAAMNAEVATPLDMASPEKYWANTLAHVVLLYGVSTVLSPLVRAMGSAS